jgi:tetratricopeptide (TPR) repeat protein
MTARKKKAKSGASAAVKTKAAAAVAAATALTAADTSGSIDIVLAEAAAAAAAGELDAAADGYARAAAMAPRRVDVLDALADALMEAGRPEEAGGVLKRAIELAPQTGFEKYMYLAQLLGGTMEAVEAGRVGLEVLRKEKKALESAVASGTTTADGGGCGEGTVAGRLEELADFEVSALCGVAEALLAVIEESGDQAVADRLDGEVERAVGDALAVCVTGSAGEMEASLALANLRLSQARADDARAAMGRVVAGMVPGLDVLDDEEGGDESIVRGIGMLPAVGMRVAVGKQLVEVELWEDAVRVLSSVLYECDFNVEVWYMLAIAFHRLEDDVQALAALESVRTAFASPEGYDGQLADGAVEDLEAVIRGDAPDNARRKGNDGGDCGDSDGGGGDDDMED